MTEINEKMLDGIRSASRNLVRKFGFMNRTLAGTRYSPSAVHAIIEIGASGITTGKTLSGTLFLEKSSISRLVQTLISHGEVEERKSDIDARQKDLLLTPKGEKTLRDIHSFGMNQVSSALEALDEKSREAILSGLRLYSNALKAENEIQLHERITIHEGYRVELIGNIASLHAKIYSKMAGFDAYFETMVAKNYANFMSRIDHKNNNTWYAEQQGRIVGGISIDGEALGNNIAHLRWFIVDEKLQSAGLGGKLLKMAIDYCDKQGFAEVQLETFNGLDAARKLYEQHGFNLVGEVWGDSYGKKVLEQKFIRKCT